MFLQRHDARAGLNGDDLMTFLSNPRSATFFRYRNARRRLGAGLLFAALWLLPNAAARAINLTNNGGTPTFGSSQVWPNPSTFTNNSGTATFTADSGTSSSTPLSIIVNGGSVTLAATQHLNALTINAGKTTLTSGTLKTNVLAIASSAGNFSGALDLGLQPAVVEPTASAKASALSALQAEVAYGKTHTTGIISSTLASNMTIAIVDNASFGQTTFRGVAVDGNSLLVVPALLGDSNLDGNVDLSDLNTVLNNLGGTTSDFTAGNFDGAATIDLTDLNDVLNNLGTSVPTGNVFMATQARLMPSVVAAPEPASLMVLAVCGGLIVSMRHRAARFA
jgi:hypothetical protein